VDDQPPGMKLHFDIQLVKSSLVILDSRSIDIALLGYPAVRIVFGPVKIAATQRSQHVSSSITEIAQVTTISVRSGSKHDVTLLRCVADSIQWVFWFLASQISTIMVSLSVHFSSASRGEPKMLGLGAALATIDPRMQYYRVYVVSTA